MSGTPKDGGPAFPANVKWDNEGSIINEGQPGMSLRDWFAGMALQGILACPTPISTDGKVEKPQTAAYLFADAMLAERAKEAK